jgi:hypothetical protein
MPRLSVWLVRASFIHLFLGLTFGGLILANKGIPFAPWTWGLLPAHMEFLLIGWMVQLTMGVAFWILPRFRSGPPRGNVNFVWGALVLLNVGIIMIAVQPFIDMTWLVFTGRILETSAILLFIIASWQRVKPLEI